MVTASMLYLHLHDHPLFRQFPRATASVYGKSMQYVEGWTPIGRQRRFGKMPTRWFVRDPDRDHEMWVEASDIGDTGASVEELLA